MPLRRILLRRAICLSLLVLLAGIRSIQAGSATWTINPPTTSWNSATNWMPATVPNSPTDTATFGATNQGLPVIHSDIELDTLLFTPDHLVSTTITVGDPLGTVASFTLSGAGVINNAAPLQSADQSIQAAPTSATDGQRNGIYFKNNAAILTDGSLTASFVYAEGGQSAGSTGGVIEFLDSSTTGTSTLPAGIIALEGENGGSAGEVFFLDKSSLGNGDVVTRTGGDGSMPGVAYFMGSSTAANGDVTNWNTQAANVEGGKTFFLESSTAGAADIFSGGGAFGANAGGGSVTFSDTASAGSARLTATGGLQGGLGASINFLAASTGGTAQVELSGNATLIISDHDAPGITIGSLGNALGGGGGIVTIGTNNLIVGNNNLSTNFSGSIEGTGSVTKLGTGTLTLSGNSTYTGSTTVSGGVLRVSNPAGSGTGTGAVRVLKGTLAGGGTIAGSVTLGKGAIVAPSVGTMGTHHSDRSLTIQSALHFLTGSAHSSQLNTAGRSPADQVVAAGVTIARGAHFQVTVTGSGTLSVGSAFEVISNTSTDPISGTFDNLPDGGTITANGYTFQASYEGGDGNDLTLTVQ